MTCGGNQSSFFIFNRKKFMKTIIIFATLICILNKASASSLDSIPANSKDVESPEAIIKAVYEVISGPAGEKRNWDRMRTLFVPDARMIATGKKPGGEAVRRPHTVEEYIASSAPFLEKNGFFEKEIGRKTERYGSIAHVFSSYESKKTEADEKPLARGINSFQLWFDGKRWWVINLIWEGETKENPIPSKYIGNRD